MVKANSLMMTLVLLLPTVSWAELLYSQGSESSQQRQSEGMGNRINEQIFRPPERKKIVVSQQIIDELSDSGIEIALSTNPVSALSSISNKVVPIVVKFENGGRTLNFKSIKNFRDWFRYWNKKNPFGMGNFKVLSQIGGLEIGRFRIGSPLLMLGGDKGVASRLIRYSRHTGGSMSAKQSYGIQIGSSLYNNIFASLDEAQKYVESYGKNGGIIKIVGEDRHTYGIWDGVVGGWQSKPWSDKANQFRDFVQTTHTVAGAGGR
jgi:hypothetical protein